MAGTSAGAKKGWASRKGGGKSARFNTKMIKKGKKQGETARKPAHEKRMNLKTSAKAGKGGSGNTRALRKIKQKETLRKQGGF